MIAFRLVSTALAGDLDRPFERRASTKASTCGVVSRDSRVVSRNGRCGA
jgi:hypothetical protein